MVPPTGDKTAETSEHAAGHARMSEKTLLILLLHQVASEPPTLGGRKTQTL